jgi:hypothetical protein
MEGFNSSWFLSLAFALFLLGAQLLIPKRKLLGNLCLIAAAIFAVVGFRAYGQSFKRATESN